jgi:hypothetical protein
MIDAIPAPPDGFARSLEYVARPRERRSFHTVLEAAALLGGSHRVLTVTTAREGDDISVGLAIQLAEGRIHESFRAIAGAGGLRAHTMVRTVTDVNQAVIREERAEFTGRLLALPQATYPEVMLPFMLGWFPQDGRRRSLYAWINDRFVARVYVESGKRTRIDLPGGRADAIECVMYPDLNDWVPIGNTLSQLAKPFVPKYRMWLQPTSPFTLLRFEGPYGPPGAPEFVIELSAGSR